MTMAARVRRVLTARTKPTSETVRARAAAIAAPRAAIQAARRCHDCVCAVGYYRDTSQSPVCVSCGADHTTSGTGSTDVSSCVCTAGHYDVGGTCTDCADGTYKAAIGDGACTSCGNSGTTGGNTGSMTATDCVCAVGYYRDTSQSPVCVSCGADHTTSGTGSTDVSSCVCTAGHYDDGGTCTACADGTYKAAIGDGACTSCGNSGTTGGNTGSDAAGCDRLRVRGRVLPGHEPVPCVCELRHGSYHEWHGQHGCELLRVHCGAL